jgi:hypothetical protein
MRSETKVPNVPEPAATDASIALTPLTPVYPFNGPGQPVLLHHGLIGGLASSDVEGSIELSCTPKPNIEWRVEPWAFTPNRIGSEVMLLLRRPNGDGQVPVQVHELGGGWSNGAVIGGTDIPLTRVVAHWFNLPNWHGPGLLTETTSDGYQHWWSGRWIMEVSGWRITLDVRRDHSQVWTDLHKSDVFVMTHVMELTRSDGSQFTADEAEPVLAALHIGVSFALGRWAAPMLPVGEDASGNVVWEDWHGLHCDPARNPSSGWWWDQDHATLTELLKTVVPVFADPDRREILRFQLMLAILTVPDRGFVDQRVVTAAPGLEHLIFQSLVVNGTLNRKQYRAKDAHEKLRAVLGAAHIPVDIDATLQPVLAQFAADETKRQGKNLDGPDMVTHIRNRLVHPSGAHEQLYKRSGLLMEAWLLTRHYLVLLILHSIGYSGPYRDLRRITGWASDVGSVPWASP